VKFERIQGNISQLSSYIRIFYFNIKPHLSKHGETSTQKPSWRSISALVMRRHCNPVIKIHNTGKCDAGPFYLLYQEAARK
jgi:hypothetical protein